MLCADWVCWCTCVGVTCCCTRALMYLCMCLCTVYVFYISERAWCAYSACSACCVLCIRLCVVSLLCTYCCHVDSRGIFLLGYILCCAEFFSAFRIATVTVRWNFPGTGLSCTGNCGRLEYPRFRILLPSSWLYRFCACLFS